jgi:hypothetical protein
MTKQVQSSNFTMVRLNSQNNKNDILNLEKQLQCILNEKEVHFTSIKVCQVFLQFSTLNQVDLAGGRFPFPVLGFYVSSS